MERATVDFGIDLGTTNSSIAVIKGVNTELFKNNEGQEYTPSAVYLDKKNRLHVGYRAKQRLYDDPDNAYSAFKLLMGKQQIYHFGTSGRQMSPEELSAEVLKSLRGAVKQRTGEDVNAAIIGVPAAFELPQNEATKKAAQLAGILYSPLIQEPAAAAMTYGFQSKSDKVFWMVYDFGGGTFDAAIIQIREGEIQVINHGGDNHLGGNDIDWKIVDRLLLPVAKKEYGLIDFKRGNIEWRGASAQLKEKAEEAKIQLSADHDAEITIHQLCQGKDGKWIQFEHELQRADIEALIEPFVMKSVDICKRVLEEKRLSPHNIEKMILVGGPTLTPIFREILTEKLGIPLEFSIDPLTVVARGAAIFAGTQRIPKEMRKTVVAPGQYMVDLEYQPMGPELEPLIGGTVKAPKGEALANFTIEFVESTSQWRSGKINLGADGAFMTNVVAEEGRANIFLIELRNDKGVLRECSPAEFTYTAGTIVEKGVPLTHSVGVVLASNEMAVYLSKGTPLPARHRETHHTTIALNRGESGTILRIPVVEGENIKRADRNPTIGTVLIPGDRVKLDLPVGSEVEVTIEIDESRLVKTEAYIPILDEVYDEPMKLGKIAPKSHKQLLADFKQEKDRLQKVQDKAQETRIAKAEELLEKIRLEQMVEDVELLLEAARNDTLSADKCQRSLLELAIAIDKIEDEFKWPALVEQAEKELEQDREIVNRYGTASDKSRFESLENETRVAISAQNFDLLSQKIDELDTLTILILAQQDGWWISIFNNRVGRKSEMRDQSLAERLINQGRHAIDRGDIEELRSIVAQLDSIMIRPEHARPDKSHITW
jgi:molecular chaperone DnaK